MVGEVADYPGGVMQCHMSHGGVILCYMVLHGGVMQCYKG